MTLWSFETEGCGDLRLSSQSSTESAAGTSRKLCRHGPKPSYKREAICPDGRYCPAVGNDKSIGSAERKTSGRSVPRRLGGWILLLSGLTFLSLAVLVQLALWDSRGHLPAFIEGQFDRGPPLVGGDTPHAPAYEVKITVDPTTILRTVDERYLSFAIDTSAVVGGKWWNPEASGPEMGSGTVNAPIFDFNRERLDTLVQELSPAYLRIGGSEADKVFYNLGGSGSSTIAAGFDSVLTRKQWDDVNAFTQRNNLSLVMTLNAGPSTRDETGRWRSDNAEELIKYTVAQGYQVTEWELGNELNLFWFVHGLDKQVSATQYAKDLLRLQRTVARLDPDARVSGQGAAFWPVLGEPLKLFYGFQEDYARLSGKDTHTFAWHYYPQQSRRGPIASRRANPGRLLVPDNLNEVVHWARFNAALKDKYAPNAELWLGETGNAQFGGEPGLSDRFLASLWWMDQLGILAVHDHDVVVRQTLVGSNYQLITDDTLEPLPDYWASLLWKRLMGRTVLFARVEGSNKLRAYAHRTPEGDGATLLLINLEHRRPAKAQLAGLHGALEMYVMTAKDPFGTEVRLGHQTLNLLDEGKVPKLQGQCLLKGTRSVSVPPLAFVFVRSPARDCGGS